MSILTIVIPTRDRHNTLSITVSHLLREPIEGVEVLVVDNACQPPVSQVIGSHKNLRVVRTNDRLDMIKNWRFGLSQIRTKYFTVIGDDDFVWKRSLTSILAFLKLNDTPLISWNRSAIYWPDYPDERFRGNLYLPLGPSAKRISCRELFDHMFLKTFDPFSLPGVYNSIVNTEHAKLRIRHIEDLIPADALTPDIGSAMRFPLVFDEGILLAQPVTLSGISGQSNMIEKNANLFLNEFEEKERFPLWIWNGARPLTVQGRGMLAHCHDFCAAYVTPSQHISDIDVPWEFLEKLWEYYINNFLAISHGFFCQIVKELEAKKEEARARSGRHFLLPSISDWHYVKLFTGDVGEFFVQFENYLNQFPNVDFSDVISRID